MKIDSKDFRVRPGKTVTRNQPLPYGHGSVKSVSGL
jgi:hypothetical protein